MAISNITLSFNLMAIEMKLPKALKCLLEMGMEVNATFQIHRKPIHLAVAVNWLQGVEILTNSPSIDLETLSKIKTRNRKIREFLQSIVKQQCSASLPLAPQKQGTASSSRSSSKQHRKSRLERKTPGSSSAPSSNRGRKPPSSKSPATPVAVNPSTPSGSSQQDAGCMIL